MDEMPIFKLSLRLRLVLWAHEHPFLLLALSVSGFLVVWAS